MKKVVVIILLLCQVGWVLHGGVLVTNKQVDSLQQYSYNYVGFYGLVKIACTTFVESINRVVEVSCDLPIFPEDKNSEEPIQKVQIIFVNFLINISVRCFFRLVEPTSVLRDDYKLQITDYRLHLFYVWLTFLFLYLHRLRYFFLLARSSISDSLVLIKIYKVGGDPNCFWEVSREQLGFFLLYNSK